MKKLFKKKAKNAPIAAAPVRASAGATVAIDNAGHSSDVSFMSMGGAESEADLSEAESYESPRAGEKLERGRDSYADNALYTRPGASGASAAAAAPEIYRMEASKEAWDESLDADVAATAAVLAEQMQSNPDDANQVALQKQDDLSQFSDPLGMGVLNETTLALEREEAGAGNTRRQLQKLARWQAGATMKLGAGQAADGAGGGTARPQGPAAMLSKLQVSSREFNPWVYLGTVHTETSREQITEGLSALDATLQQRKGQLRQLVKANFQRFIGCKGTIDDISLRLKENEAMSSTSGSTKLVAIAAADAEAAAKESFAAILQRQEEANAVKQKLLLLSRFEALFRLPGRVAQLAAARDFEGVVAEYCKGKKLIPVQDHALWAEVSRRLEDQVDLVFNTLMSEILDTNSDLPTVVRAIKLLELLCAEGLPAAKAVKPLSKFTSSQREYLQQRLRFVADQHVEAVVAIQAMGDAAKETAVPDALASRSVDEDMHDPASHCTNAQLAWLGLLRGLAGFYTTELRLLAHVAASEELAASYKANLQQETWKAAVREMRGVMVELRKHVEQELQSTLKTLWQEPDGRLVAHVQALNTLSEARAALDDTCPRDVMESVDTVARSVLDHGVKTLEDTLCSWGAQQDDWEHWRIDPGVMTARQPVSRALWSVHNGASTAMLQFAALNQVAQSSCKVTLDNVHERISAAFLQRLAHIGQKMRAMLAEVRKVAASQLKAHKKHGRLFTVNTAAGGGAANGKNGDATAGSGGGGAGDALSAPMMALSLLSNTNYLIHTGLHALTLPRLPLMYPGDRAAQDRCMDKVDEVVADLKRVRDEAGNEYVALQGALLRASVKHYLTSDGTLWDSMPLKKELRDATYDMAFALVLVMNQVVSHATTSVHDLMTRLCEGIMASLLEFLGNTIGVMSPAALATLFLEMNFIEGIIPDVLKTEDFDNRINDCYELLLTQLLRLVKTKMPSTKTEFGKVVASVDLRGEDPMGSLHSCLEAYAFKVLPSHAQRANLHFDCFKALATEKTGADQKVRATGLFSWQAPPKPQRGRRRRAPEEQGQPGGQVSLEGLVSGMAGKLESIFVAEDD